MEILCNRALTYVFMLATHCICLTYGWAGEESFKIAVSKDLQSTPYDADIELLTSYDGSLGDVSLCITARSTDNLVASYGCIPIFMPVGTDVRTVVKVLGPYGLNAQRSDLITAHFYQNRQAFSLFRSASWPHAWPSITPQDYEPSKGRSLENPIHGSIRAFATPLRDDDFAAVDTLVDNWSQTGERDTDGNWRLASFTEAVRADMARMDLKEGIKRIRKWKRLNPQSTGASVAEANYWIDCALREQNVDDGLKFDKSAKKLFHQHIIAAEKALNSSKAYGVNNPIWYDASLRLALVSRKKGRIVEKLFEEAVSRHPRYLPLYLQMIDYQTFGSKNYFVAINELANKAISSTSDTDGISSFARIYSHITYAHPFQLDLFKDGVIAWPKMKVGLQDLIDRYPSLGNLNMFAMFACRAGDRGAYQNIRPRIIHSILADLWPSNTSLDLCDQRFLKYS